MSVVRVLMMTMTGVLSARGMQLRDGYLAAGYEVEVRTAGHDNGYSRAPILLDDMQERRPQRYDRKFHSERRNQWKR